MREAVGEEGWMMSRMVPRWPAKMPPWTLTSVPTVRVLGLTSSTSMSEESMPKNCWNAPISYCGMTE